MGLAVQRYWIVLAFAVLFAAPAARAETVEDNREASFLPPPAALLSVDETAEKEAAAPQKTDEKPAVKQPEKTTEKAVEKPAPKPAVEPVAKVAPPVTAPKLTDIQPVIIEGAKPESKKEGKEAVVTSSASTNVPPASSVQPVPPIGAPTAVTFPPAAQESAPVPVTASAAPPAQVEPVKLAEEVAKAPLADVDPETLGLLSPANGGLGAALWKDTSRTVIDRLLPSVGLPTGSATLNDLARRAFLTTAAAPAPSSDKDKPSRSLLSQRIEALMALGAVTDAWKLASLADPKLVDAVTLRLLTEAALIGPDSKEICDKIPSLMAAHGKTAETGAEWQKSLLVCQLRANDQKAVQLGIDLMREQASKDDIFLSLMSKNVLAGSKQLPRQLTPLRPLNLAVLRQLEIPLPPELFARAEAVIVPEIVQAKAADEKARIQLAEKSAAKGLLTAAQLGAVYKSVTFTPDEITSANTSSEVSPRSRALAYQAAVNEQAAAKKVVLIKKVMDGLESNALTGTQGQLVAGLLEMVPVATDYNIYAVELARIFALAGKPDKAAAWLAAAQHASTQSGEIKAQLAAQWPLFVLSGLIPDGDYAQGLKAWLDGALAVEATSQDGNEISRRRTYAGYVLLLLHAADYAVSEESWQRVIEPEAPVKQTMPSPVLMERLAQAAATARRGEVVLLSLMLMGQGSDVPLPVKTALVAALRQIGLTADAQALAREVLLSLGPV